MTDDATEGKKSGRLARVRERWQGASRSWRWLTVLLACLAVGVLAIWAISAFFSEDEAKKGSGQGNLLSALSADREEGEKSPTKAPAVQAITTNPRESEDCVEAVEKAMVSGLTKQEVSCVATNCCRRLQINSQSYGSECRILTYAALKKE